MTVSAVLMAGMLGVPTNRIRAAGHLLLRGTVFSLLLAGFYNLTGFGLRTLGQASDLGS